MIGMPVGYKQSRAAGDFEKIPAGGYICQIIEAEVEIFNNAPRLLLKLDIADGKFKGYYKEQQLSFSSGKWGCVFRQNIEGAGLPYFKGLISSIDQSNPGFECFQGTQLDERRLTGRYIGFVFGEEEYINKQNILKTIAKPQMPRSTLSIKKGDYSIPAPKKTNAELSLEQQGFKRLDDAQLPF